jgi:DNA modification methylase
VPDTAQTADAEAEARTITYVRLDDVREAELNPKEHDLEAIRKSIERFGFVSPGLRDERTGRLIAGHGRTIALRAMRYAQDDPPAGVRLDDDGAWMVPVITGWASKNDAEAAAYLVIDNHHPSLGGWDEPGLADLLEGIRTADESLLDLTGFDDDEIAALLGEANDDDAGGPGGPGEKITTPEPARLTDDDAIPEVDDKRPAIAQLGDLFELGPHRIMCADTTDPATVARLFTGLAPAIMIHADPPYGMGKESDGVLNDNLYRAALDAFQQQWWTAWTPHTAENGSAYVWGNAPDLWRWWYLGGLAEWPGIVMRNEIVWDKASTPGMRSAGGHSYPIATERCLFVMLGEQFLGNQNKDAYWEGYEPIRSHLEAERTRAGWSNKDVNRITGTHMGGHWFGKSQFAIISRKHYDTLAAAAEGRAFTEPYEDLFRRLFPDVRGGGNQHRRDLAAELRETRTPFDNAHDAMRDVWEFSRVVGEDRHGHATPKPVAMVERAFKSSSRPGDVVAVPFGGSGPEFIAGHHLGRTVVAAELHPPYVDVICRRYQQHTGTTPVRVRPDGTREDVDFTR